LRSQGTQEKKATQQNDRGKFPNRSLS